jgi:hypothetical protein
MTPDELLLWYIDLAREPGWKAYVWQRVQELAKNNTGMYSHFPVELVAALRTE